MQRRRIICYNNIATIRPTRKEESPCKKQSGKVHIKAGSAVTFDTPLYALTVKIAAINNQGKATVKTALKQKIGDGMFSRSMIRKKVLHGNSSETE